MQTATTRSLKVPDELVASLSDEMTNKEQKHKPGLLLIRFNSSQIQKANPLKEFSRPRSSDAAQRPKSLIYIGPIILTTEKQFILRT